MINKIVIIGFLVIIWLVNRDVIAQNTPKPQNNASQNLQLPRLNYPLLVNKLYELTGDKLRWFATGYLSALIKKEFKSRIDSAANIGLQKTKYHFLELEKNFDRNFLIQDSLAATQMDRIFTDAAITYCKDVYQGSDISKWMMYDEISRKYEDADNSYLVNKLATIASVNDFLVFLNSLETKSNEYLALKNTMKSKSDSLTVSEKKQLGTALNFYRWIQHFNFEKYIIVNIPAATLRYFQSDSLKLKMKLVVGKPSTRTPRFAAYCNQVILYPYWNVPSSIAKNELLPKIKHNPKYIDALNMQLVNSNGQVINPNNVNWSNYSKGYFPFRLRQSTGCDNSLGVIKFDLSSPFSVYLHDTNYKGAFKSANRFLSHGCIRLENPVDLANHILFNKIDSKYLEACFKNQVSVPLNVVRPVPVFVVYLTAETGAKNDLKFYKDIYGLLK